MSVARRLVFSPRAAGDFDQIAAYVAVGDPGRAITFVDELRTKCIAISQAPLHYPAREDLAANLRMAVHGRYLILFRHLEDTDEVRVERVLHGARDLRRLV